MQNLKLKEVIWEITNKCNNNCEYCGSRDRIHKNLIPEKLSDDRKIEIAQTIADYGVEKVNISGGDPLLVSLDMHKRVSEILKKAKVQTVILINPKSLANNPTAIEKCNLYDHVAVSINDELDKNYLCSNWIKPSCIITNFNKTNIFEFRTIAAFAKLHDVNWQIQFTMYKDDNKRSKLLKKKV